MKKGASRRTPPERIMREVISGTSRGHRRSIAGGTFPPRWPDASPVSRGREGYYGGDSSLANLQFPTVIRGTSAAITFLRTHMPPESSRLRDGERVKENIPIGAAAIFRCFFQYLPINCQSYPSCIVKSARDVASRFHDLSSLAMGTFRQKRGQAIAIFQAFRASVSHFLFLLHRLTSLYPLSDYNIYHDYNDVKGKVQICALVNH